MAIDHNYAQQDPRANLLSFRKERKLLLHLLESLPDSAWDRLGNRTPGIGPISLEALAVMILGHDGYHAHQVIAVARRGEATSKKFHRSGRTLRGTVSRRND